MIDFDMSFITGFVVFACYVLGAYSFLKGNGGGKNLRAGMEGTWKEQKKKLWS